MKHFPVYHPIEDCSPICPLTKKECNREVVCDEFGCRIEFQDFLDDEEE